MIGETFVVRLALSKAGTRVRTYLSSISRGIRLTANDTSTSFTLTAAAPTRTLTFSNLLHVKSNGDFTFTINGGTSVTARGLILIEGAGTIELARSAVDVSFEAVFA